MYPLNLLRTCMYPFSSSQGDFFIRMETFIKWIEYILMLYILSLNLSNMLNIYIR